MSRRKSSAADDLIEVVARMPWWVGVVLALISYLAFHLVAGMTTVHVTNIEQLGEHAARTIWKTLAMFGQYIVPALCLLGAAASAIRRHKRKRLLADTSGNAAGALAGMTWREFEMLIGEAFRREGYRVVETGGEGGEGADGGVDLVLSKDGEKFLVQCKHWKAFKVGVEVVRELYGVMAAVGAAGGFVVTSGTFTREAIEFADGTNLELIDGRLLRELLERAHEAGELNRAVPADRRTHAPRTSAPTCPLCAQPMVQRTAKCGANAGAQFWGCSRYPVCRGTRDVV